MTTADAPSIALCHAIGAPSASILLHARRRRNEPGTPFRAGGHGPAPTLHSPSESGHFAARARQQRADAAAAVIASAFRGMTGALRLVLAHAVRWKQQRATRDALMRCSDRVLADIGIERQHIPLVAKGIDPAERRATGQHVPALVDRRTRRVAAAWEGKARATADLPRARRLHRPRARRDRGAARRHPRDRARAPGPAPGGLSTRGGRQRAGGHHRNILAFPAPIE